jgi:hypothetical protein
VPEARNIYRTWFAIDFFSLAQSKMLSISLCAKPKEVVGRNYYKHHAALRLILRQGLLD